LGNTLVGPAAPGGSKGAPAVGTFPGAAPRATNAMSPNTKSPGVGLPQATNGSPVLNGILTDPQYRMVLKALQQRNGAEVLAQPEITTLSGRQAQCKIAEVRTIVTGIKKEALTPPGIQGTNNTESAALATEQMEFGPVLDIIPNVLTDGKTINLQVVASLTQFLGYEDSRTNRHTVYVNGKPEEAIVPQPKFRNCQLTSTLNVQDGQTIVLDGLISEHILTMKDKVPALGNLPLVDRFFRSEPKSTQKRNLLVFITPTLIDPAGNRIHEPAAK
jgi:general secretion pathway protein D